MNIQKKILIADDEPDILEILEFNLQKEGYEVICAANGNEALEKSKKHAPDMIILDVMMPGMTGHEVCEILRKLPQFTETVIIFLTAVNTESAEIKALESGADDYIAKPVSPKVLMSKVNALFRRVKKDTTGNITISGLEIDREKFMLRFNNTDIVLARKEFELISLLASRPGKVFLRNEILQRIWGSEVIVGDRTIDVHIRKIRQKTGLDCITTVKGVGYKFDM